MPDSPFLTVPELAAFLRVKISRVYEWTERRGPGSIPRYKAGSRLVFLRDEALEWFLEHQRVGDGLGRGRVSGRRHRSRSMLAGRRRGASKGMSGGQHGVRASQAMVSNGNGAARALVVPGNGDRGVAGGVAGMMPDDSGTGSADGA